MKSRLNRRWVVAVILFVASVSLGFADAVLHRAGGLLYRDPHTVPELVEVTEVPVLPGAPGTALVAAVDLSSEMPPVGNQGAQGSCVAWSIGYYDKTHTEYKEHLWDLTQTEPKRETSIRESV